MRDTVKAHAKINYTLEVLGVRPDGYHDLRSVVVPIPLCDDVEVAEAEGLSVDMPGSDLPQEKNLAWRVARALQEATGCTRGASISIVKRIPEGAGLGGGSADAAAVLNALNELWQLDLPKERICEIGATVGSDVPALVLGGTVLMEGRGERVKRIDGFELPPFERFVLRVPDVHASTPAVYAEFREEDCGRGLNDLQPAACRLYPEIARMVEQMMDEGLENVRMSGSGSAVFGWRRES